VSGGSTTGVRSYQRIFSPERRIHQVEGRPLPVPGGVPLRWLGWMLGTVLAVLAVGSGSLIVPAAAAVAAGAGGLAIGDRTAGLRLRHARVTGPGSVGFVEPVVVRRRLVGGNLVVREPGLLCRRSRLRHRVVLKAGQTLEVRP
jgi:hypothetical protein